MKNELLKQIFELLKNHFDGKITFDDPIIVKSGPHSYPVKVYGLEAAYRDIWVMDDDETWYTLEETDNNFSMIAHSIIQRLKLLSNVKD